LKIIGIIPARFASTRFPGKPLADIAGTSMVQRVYNKAEQAESLSKVMVATEDRKVFDHVKGFGGNVIMTSPDHRSGTDRCYEALRRDGKFYDFVINIQGDEPFISPKQIDVLAGSLSHKVELATLVKRIGSPKDLRNPNVVKVILNYRKEAIAFSRSPIPFIRDFPEKDWIQHHTFYKHIGIYAYRSDILDSITKLKPSVLEKAESLEQLRWIENAYSIKVTETALESKGIDTPEDLEVALKELEGRL